MKTPSPVSLKFLDPLLGNRYFQFLFWTLVMALVATIGVVILLRLGTLDSMELSLLDLKLRYRADKIQGAHAAPSKDIVIVGIDEHTNKYIRMHPELGLTSLTLPRIRLARMLDYLKKEGARAVLFDLEFKDAKPGDAEFARAIRNHGLVYAADRMDYMLGPFIDEQTQLITNQNQEARSYSAEVIFYEAMLAPVLQYRNEINNRFLGLSGSPLDVGLGPVFHPFRIEPLVEQLSDRLNWKAHFLDRFTPMSLMAAPPKLEHSSFSDLTERAYSKLCTESFYKRSYPSNDDFLKLLDRHRLNINLDGPMPEAVDRQITHCYTYPTVNPVMAALTSIGVPSIDYYDDAYIRSATVLYRGYKGNFYTYLGIRPVLDLMNIQYLSYSPGALHMGTRRIPLLDGQKVLINWRDPKLLVEGMFRESPLNPAQLPTRKAMAAQMKPLQAALARYAPLEQALWRAGIDTENRAVLEALQSQVKTGQPPESAAKHAKLAAKNPFLAQLIQSDLVALKAYLDLQIRLRTLTDQITRDQILEEIGKVQGEKNNPLLGGGHLYRLISAIDLIRKMDGKKLASDEEGRLYNVPYHPETGQFSFKNKIVIIGNTVTDIHRTPMSNTMFGPEVVAAVLDMFMHDDMFIQKPPPVILWSAVALLAVGIAIAIVMFENLPIGFTVGIILVTLYWVLNIIAFVYLGYWMEMLVPTFAMGFSLTAATLYRYYIHDQEKHHLTNVFSKYVSPQIMDEIVKNPEKALDNLKGGKKELTVLFSDLHGFTHQFENADPETIVSQLNEYFDVMTEIILDHGGTYDKYMGDSIMAFFGAPTDMSNHAEMACRAALEMQKALMLLNENWKRDGLKILAHGIGIASGEMFVGNFGSKNIKNFTVMGSNVNLGSRLEAFTRVAHWPVIISERTWALAKTCLQVRDLGMIQVKGFTEPVQAYGLESVLGDNVAQAGHKFGDGTESAGVGSDTAEDRSVG